MRRFWKGLDETFEQLRLEPQEFVDAGMVRIEYLSEWSEALEAAGFRE